tara:strand:- start:28 stop:297 length:270 start_codon:yes stop_codon:yes gene_type:complete
MKTKLFKQIDVWSKDEGSLVCYRCFEIIGEGFFVQSADYYHLDSDYAHLKQFSDKQLIELLIDLDPPDRTDLFPTLTEAIQAHVRDFYE